MHVIGTAGHVDHGKSTLVHALTGIDPDRLQEEKERGMTIDLGFAWLKLPGGEEVSIVDVPGHERFVKNMLAGVGGIDLALLLVAADEGVMPQTREHLAILDLLGVERGIVVLTKKDLVDQEWLDLVTADVEDTLKGTTLEHAPLMAVSAVTREGLPELVEALDAMLAETPAKRDAGRPRLPIDRVFTIAGFGTVVTGTLIDGVLTAGQEVEVVPQALRSRVRGLQSHKHKVETVPPGTRVAVNLAGVGTEDLSRGDIVTTAGWLKPTATLDVQLRLLADAPNPLKHNGSGTLHLLAAEVPAKVRLLDNAELAPGKTGWAQVRLQHPIAACKGDSFILRSSYGTIGGGTVIDPYPKRHKRFHAPTLSALESLEQGTPEAVLLRTLEKSDLMEVTALLRATGMPAGEARTALESLIAQGEVVVLGGRQPQPNALVVSGTVWRRTEDIARRTLDAYHSQHPLRSGMSKEELRTRLRLQSRAAGEALDLLLKNGAIVESGPTVRLPEHQVVLTALQEAQAKEILAGIEKDPYSPPALEAEPDIVSVLVDQRRVVRVAEGIVFSHRAYEEMVDRIREHLKQQGKVTVGEVRDMFGTSRKYALALMEYLDQQHVTRRVGDERVPW